jgi:hypothetical protein
VPKAELNKITKRSRFKLHVQERAVGPLHAPDLATPIGTTGGNSYSLAATQSASL